MNNYDVGYRLHKIRDVPVGIENHQMHVEGQHCGLPDAVDNKRADSEVGYEIPIHDIDVDEVCTTCLSL